MIAGIATGRPDDYVPYIDPAYRARYEEFARGIKAQRAARRKAQQEGKSLFSDAGSFGLDEETGDARDGEWNSRLRTEVLEGEGVVAEVLFPNGGVPFGGFGESAEDELRAVGNRAHDRWLLYFANETPGRRAALAMLTVHDLDATVAEIRWAAKNGMKGAIIPTVPGDGLPPYLDRRYDSLWAACEEHVLPVHIHGGGGTPDYGSYGIASMLMYATEATFFSQAQSLDPDLVRHTRPLWAHAGRVYRDARRLGAEHADAAGRHPPRALLPEHREDREAPAQRVLRAPGNGRGVVHELARGVDPNQIGVGNPRWDADFPHVEGTWPRTRKSLARCFAGVPPEDVRAILTENPARLYGFDIAALQPIADRVGPTIEELVGSA